MDKEFFHRDLRLFLERRVSWERYLRLMRPGPANVEEELATVESILGTLGDICEDIETASRPHWHEEVRLVDGRVEVPAHIAAGYDKLRQAGLVCLPVSAEYGGFGLPLLVNAGYLEMIARADASLTASATAARRSNVATCRTSPRASSRAAWT